MSNKPLLLTVREVMNILRIQRAKVYMLLELGVLEGSKIGGDWRIRTASVEKQIGGIPFDYFEQRAA